MKIVSLLNRVLKSQGQKLSKENEYMYWSPFVAHHKPKLQVNIKSGKWHCWVSSEGGHNLFQLFKKLEVTKKHYDELRELSDDFVSYKYVPNQEDLGYGENATNYERHNQTHRRKHRHSN